MDQEGLEGTPAPGPVAPSTTFVEVPIQRMYRRGVALLIEATVLLIVVYPLIWWGLGDAIVYDLPDTPIGPIRLHGETIVPACLLMFRDVFGTSPGKRLLGLRVVDASTEEAGRSPSFGQRILRNVPLLLVGLMWIVEFVAAKDDVKLRRYGDMLAKTEVVDVRPSIADWPWAWILLGTVLACGVVRQEVPAMIYDWLVALG